MFRSAYHTLAVTDNARGFGGFHVDLGVLAVWFRPSRIVEGVDEESAREILLVNPLFAPSACQQVGDF
jgi:hypothetical protein